MLILYRQIGIFWLAAPPKERAGDATRAQIVDVGAEDHNQRGHRKKDDEEWHLSLASKVCKRDGDSSNGLI